MQWMPESEKPKPPKQRTLVDLYRMTPPEKTYTYQDANGQQLRVFGEGECVRVAEDFLVGLTPDSRCEQSNVNGNPPSKTKFAYIAPHFKTGPQSLCCPEDHGSRKERGKEEAKLEKADWLEARASAASGDAYYGKGGENAGKIYRVAVSVGGNGDQVEEKTKKLQAYLKRQLVAGKLT